MRYLTLIFLAIAGTSQAQSLGEPRNWVAESLNKTIIVEKNRTYTVRGSGVNVVIESRNDNHRGDVAHGQVRRFYGEAYVNDERAQRGEYVIRILPRR